jgi:putative nucleotidyltransferase with HDIG domain
MRQRDALLRMGLCLIAAVAIWGLTRAWSPPFPYRSGYVADREIIARVLFRVTDENDTAREFRAGERLVRAGQPLSFRDIQVLYTEHAAHQATASWLQRVLYSLASFGVYAGLFALCGFYIHAHDPSLYRDVRNLVTILGTVVLTMAAVVVAARDSWRAESIPLIVFGMTLAIAYRRELAFLLAVVVSLLAALSLGQGLAEFIILTSAVSVPILLLNRVRSRTKLIYVGLYGAALTFLTVIVVGTLTGQAFGASHTTHVSPADGVETFSRLESVTRLVSGAAWYGACVILAGFLTTGLLPFIERLFDVQTDIRLLELGDAAHPLLQELARRAPGTYNHSISVASIAEPAAEAVGGNGLRVRVGAYFHDIGKMLKPAYFIENQGSGGNQHDSLLPAMSTLVIVAHVKDGVDLGRQHGLPQMIIDFVEQHHGTTLVEYFYRQAERQNAQDPDGGELDESRYRYPGPKPQTKEAAVLMLADAAEGACRSLVEPTPARIESLVRELAMKRLLDGQFDDCQLTLQQLQRIEDSLVKSLTAVYHGRIVYPNQQTA